MPSCETVAAAEDDVRVPYGEIALRNMPASEFESIEFLHAIQAQMQYDIGGNTTSGAVVTFTRGRTPTLRPLADLLRTACLIQLWQRPSG